MRPPSRPPAPVLCLVSRRFAAKVPQSTVAIVAPEPYRVFAQVLRSLPERHAAGVGVRRQRHLAGYFRPPTARLEHGVTVDPGAVIGPGAEIGTGTLVGAQSVIGPQVRIGRDCSIGPNVTVSPRLRGHRVILHPGVRIGQDGFGFAMGPQGHLKVPKSVV